nr:uncharacterized protein LOC108121824 [Drosophila bipectinata]
MFLNHGSIFNRECLCRPETVSDLQMLGKDLVTNYGTMSTRKCLGVERQEAVKVKTFINHGTLVIHKCTCKTELITISDLINYGIIVNCLTSCGAKAQAIEDASINTVLQIELKNEGQNQQESPSSTQKGTDQKAEQTSQPKLSPRELTIEEIEALIPSSADSASTSRQATQKSDEYSTEMCRRCYRRYVNIMKNPELRTVKPEDRLKSKYPQCPHCWACFKKKNVFQDHLKACQLIEKPYKCKGCPYKAAEVTSLNAHHGSCYLKNTAEHISAECFASNHQKGGNRTEK